jgi:signal transduction histidine kinase
MKNRFLSSQVQPLIICIMAAASGLFPLQLMFGVEYMMAGLWGLIASVLFGPVWGAVAVLSGSLPSLIYWGHPYGIVIFFLENLIISCLIRKFRTGLTVSSLIYWIPIGLPLSYFCYKYMLQIPDFSIRFVLIKMGINGLGNAVAASLIIPLLARFISRYSDRLNSRSYSHIVRPTSLASHLSHIITAIILVMSIAQMGVHSRHMVAHEEQELAEKLVYAAEQMNLYTDTPGSFPVHEAFQLLSKRMPDLRFRLMDLEMQPGSSKEDHYGPLPPFLTGTADPSLIRAVTDRVNLWSPTLESAGSKIEQRINSVYYVDMRWNGSPRYQIFVEYQAKEIWNSIYSELTKDLGITFILLTAASLLIYPTIRRLTRPLADLAELSTRLPTSMGADFQPKWPDSPLIEIRSLTNSFRLMSMDLNRQFAGILEAAQEAMLLCDKEGNILFANSRLSYFFGSRCLSARTIDELFAHIGRSGKNSSQALLEEVAAFLRVTTPNAALKRNFTYSDGLQSHHYSLYGTVIEGTGSPLERNRLLVFRDRSEEEERELLKEEMIAQISHEFRTPLTSILGFAEIMRSKELQPSRLKTYTNTIYNEAVRLSRLVDDFLDLQRMESGKQTYYLVPHDIRELASQVTEQWKLENMRRLHLALPEEPVIAMVDADRIRQVLHNLVGNAFKYSPDGAHVDITVSMDGGAIIIDVADEGLGIPDADKDKIFRKFYRVENNDRRKISGSGLGLPIAKEIVEGHNGQITFISRHYGGSIFTVWLPRYNPPKTGGTFLLIEKDDQYAEALTTVLEQQGEAVLRLGSFEEALFAIGCGTTGMPRIIAADLVGRGLMNGLEFASRLLALGNPSPAPVVFLEKLGPPGSRPERQDQKQGAMKPFTARELLPVLEAVARPIPAVLMIEGQRLEPLRCYFPAQDTGLLKMQLAKFGLQPKSLQQEGDIVAAVFPHKSASRS